MIKKIKNPKLKNSSFAVVPIPFEDELFSSWFVRTAYAHHTHPHTFLQLHLNKHCQTMVSNNLDVSISDMEIRELEYKCKNKISLYNKTLKSYSGYLQENIINNGSNKLVCNLRFCPKCLRDDKIVYFRKQWKVVFNAVCTKHGCYLYDSCVKCNSKIFISKMYQNKFSFKYCSKCGFDLSKSRAIKLKGNAIQSIKYIDKLNNILEVGYVNFENSIVYSFHFFDAIFQLCKKVLKHKKYQYIDNFHLFKYLAVNKVYSKYKPTYFQISIKEQFALFSIIMKLFDNYPKNFEKYIRTNNLSHWQMTRDMEYVSFWYENLINNITPRFIPVTKLITQEEIENGKKYLISQNILVNKASLSRLFGCSFFSIYNSLFI